jgi:hypothetical protein
MNDWIVAISSIIAVIGAYLYGLELLRDRVTCTTSWHQLNKFQLQAAVMTISGTAIALSALIIGAVLRSYA